MSETPRPHDQPHERGTFETFEPSERTKEYIELAFSERFDHLASEKMKEKFKALAYEIARHTPPQPDGTHESLLAVAVNRLRQALGGAIWAVTSDWRGSTGP